MALQHLRRITTTESLFRLHDSTRYAFARGLRTLQRGTSTNSPTQYESFFRFQRGRWLWNEQARLRERYRRFNVAELRKVAAKAVGASRCISITKFGEGNSNKAFRLAMDNGAVVVAKIPNPNAGPSRLLTASEVAIMDFVLAWDCESDNSVEAEYIIMEEASGTHLQGVWEDLDVDIKDQIVGDLVNVEKKLASASMTAYGSLYYRENAPSGSVTAELQGDFSAHIREQARQRFVIGETTEDTFWVRERANLSTDRGPWITPLAYLQAIALRVMSWIQDYADPAVIEPGFNIPGSEADLLSQEDLMVHVQLHKRFLDVAPYLSSPIPAIMDPRLFHHDLRPANLFIEDNQISSVIDWQEMSFSPLLYNARSPSFIQYSGEQQLFLPEGYEKLKGEERDQVANHVECCILSYGYHKKTRQRNEIVQNVYSHPKWLLIQQIVAHANTSWERGVVPFRQVLYNAAMDWDQIAPGVDCPVGLFEDEIRRHGEETVGYRANVAFWEEQPYSREGYVSPEDYDEALEYFRDLREKYLEQLEGFPREIFAKQTEWAARE